MINYFLKIISISALLISSSLYAAVFETGTFKVESLRLTSTAINVRFKPAPTSCNGGDSVRMHARVLNTAPAYDEYVTMLLAAYTAGLSFKVITFDAAYVSPELCDSTHILNIANLELSLRN